MYIYKDRPDWREKAAESFSDAFTRSLESAMLRKRKKEDEAQELMQKIQFAGLEEIRPSLNVMAGVDGNTVKPTLDADYENVIKLGDKTYGKRLSGYDKKKRDLELDVLRKKSTTESIEDKVTRLEAESRAKAQGTASVKKPSDQLAEEKFVAGQSEKEATEKAKSDAFRTTAESALKTVAKVREGINYFGLPKVNPLGYIPGSKQVNWRSSLNKLLAGRILNVLGEMKAQSRTGATGFGQLNAGELKVITDASTELKEELSPKRAAELLNEMETAFMRIVENESAKGGQPTSTTDQPRIAPLTATNPTTGQKITSYDGGQTWE